VLTSFATVSSTVAPGVDDELPLLQSPARRVREHAPTPTSSLIRNRGNHMALIDGIALLLDKSDVAAVSFEQTPTSIDFFYAKNRPCLTSEKNYIDAI
jgi:hypothetical protein